MYLIEIYVTNATLNINHPFTYYYDVDIERYKRVNVIFAKSENIGIVFNSTYTDKPLEEIEAEYGYKLNKIISVIDEYPIITDEQFKLGFWLSKTTISPLISCLNAMLPKALKTSKNIANIKKVQKIRKIKELDNLTNKQKEIYSQLSDGMLLKDARALSTSIIKKLIDLKSIEIYEEEYEYQNDEIIHKGFQTLTPEQELAYNTIINTDKKVSLLFGITGSGKTEVYLYLARHYLNQGKEVLILVPEISLTPQMIKRVKERFDDVIFYHSELNNQERYEQYKRVKQGEVKIVVGTRSSIFLPFNNLGLIIIDEEHDQSYKQDSIPCYHAKNVAIKRAYDFDAKVVLASATPSLESYTRALKKDYELVELKNRINNMIPEIEIVDLTNEIKSKGSYIISRRLRNELDNCLNKHKQAIILLNRRGYSPIIKCSSCGETLMCNDCDRPLNYHKDENILKCHECGRIYKMPSMCPKCKQNTLIHYGFGTKRVEEEIKRIYPKARIDRMDRDNVNKKGASAKILDAFGRHEIDILIGTQMISKGLDYPDVTLVGILNADAGLMHQDYNSAKITFDLLMQASGRSGRSKDPGKVIIQAFNVDHYVLKAIYNQDYLYFYNIEMNYRHKAKYPPYSHMIEIIIDDTNIDKLNKSVEYLKNKINKLSYKIFPIFELPKIMKRHRYRIIVMDSNIINMLNDIHDIVNDYINKKTFSRIVIDVDPLYLE